MVTPLPSSQSPCPPTVQQTPKQTVHRNQNPTKLSQTRLTCHLSDLSRGAAFLLWPRCLERLPPLPPVVVFMLSSRQKSHTHPPLYPPPAVSSFFCFCAFPIASPTRPRFECADGPRETNDSPSANACWREPPVSPSASEEAAGR